MISIKIMKKLVKPLLYLSQFFNDNFFLLVCKGYDEDYDVYTGLYWVDDKDLDIYDNSYSDFQLWVRVFQKTQEV